PLFLPLFLALFLALSCYVEAGVHSPCCSRPAGAQLFVYRLNQGIVKMIRYIFLFRVLVRRQFVGRQHDELQASARVKHSPLEHLERFPRSAVSRKALGSRYRCARRHLCSQLGQLYSNPVFAPLGTSAVLWMTRGKWLAVS